MAGPWDTVPAPNYAAFDSGAVGNALSNLVGNYQAAQLGQQRTQSNDLRNQQDQMLLNQQKAFAGGVPMNPDGSPNLSAIMKTLVEKGDTNAIGALEPLILEQQNIQGANAPSTLQWGAGGSSGGGLSSNAVAPPAPGPWSGNQFLSTLVGAETEGNNSAIGDGGLAKGDFQFHDATWQKYAQNVPGADKYASADQAPPGLQQAVAETAPISEWGDRTRRILHAKFGSFDESQTIGQLAQQFGGGTGGPQVASLGGEDATAYADPNKPTIPPVSAAIGTAIPRDASATAQGAVGGASPQPTPIPQQLAANNPAWANTGITAALPVGPVGAPAPQAAPAAPASAPQAPAAPQASVASIGAQMGIPPQVAANIAGIVLGVAPNAPLTPEQSARAKTIIQNTAQRLAQNGQQQGGGPLVPQMGLPNGIKDPMAAVAAINQDIDRLSKFTAGRGGEIARERIKLREWQRDQILKQSTPVEGRPGEMFLSPSTGKPMLQVPSASASTIALQRFLEENKDATAEQIQQFVQAGRGGARSGIGMYMQRYLQEHPNASDEDVKKAAQDYQSEGSALTKFTSGPQGNAIRSFNVVVDHLGVLGEAVDALKNGNIQLFNRAAQAYAQQTGSSAPTDFNATKEIVGDEIVKAVVGSGSGALGDRDAIKATVALANSPQQLYGVINKYRELANGQLKGLGKQYSEATGRDDFDRFLAPGTKAFFEGKGEKKSDQGDKGSSGGLPAGWSVEVH